MKKMAVTWPMGKQRTEEGCMEHAVETRNLHPQTSAPLLASFGDFPFPSILISTVPTPRSEETPDAHFRSSSHTVSSDRRQSSC